MPIIYAFPGPGAGVNSFSTIQPDNGTSPVASGGNDTLTLTSSDGTITITGNSGAKSINFQGRIADATHTGILSLLAQTLVGEKTFSTPPTSPSSGTTSECWGDASVSTGTSNVVIGQGTNDQGCTSSVIIGQGTTSISAGGNGMVMVGQSTSFTTNFFAASVIIGQGASHSGSGLTTVIGQGASSTIGNNLVIGQTATSHANGGVAIGFASSNTGAGSTLLGGNTSDGGFANCTIIGGGNITATAASQCIIGGGWTTMYLGKTVASTTAQSITITPTGASGNNKAGVNLTIEAGQSTGTAAGGNLLFNISPAGAAGSTLGNGFTNVVTITSSQKTGILQSSPTAYLHLGAGVTTSNGSPLKFTTGQLLTTPEQGSVEYDGVNFYGTRVAQRRIFNLSNDSITSATTVANTTTETAVFTSSISANSVIAGQIYRTNFAGVYSTANGADTFQMRYKIGATTILTMSSSAANVTNAPFHSEILACIRTTGAGGALIAHGTIDSNSQAFDQSNTTTTAINTTVGNTFTITIQWSNALAGDTFTGNIGFTELM